MTNWDKVDIEITREITREAELYLQGQLTLATSADQRASILGGIFTAAGTALIAGLIAAPTPSTPPIFGGLVSAAMFLAGAGFCISTALPANFYLPGNQPSSWDEDIADGREFKRSLGDCAQNAQEEIEHNRATLKKNAGRYRAGAVLGVLSPIAGLVVWFLMSVKWPTAG